MSRRVTVILILCVVWLAGCGQITPAQNQASPATAAGSVEPVFAFSEAVVGRNRIAIGLVRNNTPLNDPSAKVHLRFYNLGETDGSIKFESDATYYGAGLPAAFYVAYPTFDQAGAWGVEIQTQISGQAQPSVSKQRLEVRESSDVPNIGQPATSVKTLTVNDVPAITQLSSGPNPDAAMYQISLDQALVSGKPTALLFATPAYCRTATCGPSLEVMQSLQQQYGTQINFIHVEVYRYPFEQSVQAQQEAANTAAQANRMLTETEAQTGLADAMIAWHLSSEPWLFLIDAKGVIAARYEGGITKEEIGPALEKLIAGQAVF